MAITRQDARQASGLDKDLLLLMIALESDVQGYLDSASQQMLSDVNKHSSTLGIKDQDSLETALIATLVVLFILLSDRIIDANVDITKLRVKRALDEAIPLLTRAGAIEEARAFRAELSTAPDDTKKTFGTRKTGPDGTTFDGRIKTIQEGAEKTVRNIITNAVKDGKGAKDIAKLIEGYVNPLPGGPRTAPWEAYRRRFGRPKTFRPDIPAGSVQSNAMRIARTETAEFYRDTTTKFYQDKDWAVGYRWVLSNSHHHKDICDELSRQRFTKDDDRPFSHPYCICDWQAELATANEIKGLIRQGAVA